MKYYVVDAFTDEVFKGNPAGVCLLEKELDAALMQSIAAENNLSETAFALKRDGYYDLRWFTPVTEIDLCGHATLGTAFVIMNFVHVYDKIIFKTRSGELVVTKNDDLYELDFPSREMKPTAVTAEMEHAAGGKVLEAHASERELMLLLESEQQVKNVVPDFDSIKKIAHHLVAIAAKGDSADFVSRVFAPNMGIDEDPVTGSAHTWMIPFWAKRLGTKKMTARQLSKRGGYLYCEDCGERVKIAGKAVLYLKGEITVN